MRGLSSRYVNSPRSMKRLFINIYRRNPTSRRVQCTEKLMRHRLEDIWQQRPRCSRRDLVLGFDCQIAEPLEATAREAFEHGLDW